MLRDSDSPERQIEKLWRINQALIERLDRVENARSSTYALSQTAAVLEKEVLARNRDLERALTDLSRTNRELDLAREVAEEANRAKSRFLRAASHDLLQPLSAAKLLLSHLEDISCDPVQADLVARIGAAFDSAEELIRALLDISQLDSRALEVTPEPVSLGRLFQRLAADFHGQAAARGLDLRFVPTAATVLSSPVFLRGIVQNLVSNAIKYTRRGRVLVGARRRDGMIWLEVHDTGPGIPPADQERIFNEFERLAPDAAVPGNGLGLSIVRRACLRLGHELTLDSTPGRGTLFRVQLPPAPSAAARGGLAAPDQRLPQTPARDRLRLSGCTAIVVENDAAMRHAYMLLLQSWGVQVAAAAGTEDARALLRAGVRPQILVTDYQLDRGDTGMRTIAALRDDLGACLPALLVTAERSADLPEAARRAGALLLEKPVAETDLHAAVLRLLQVQA
ncbi:hybrid sensor histidine kinase/response regulator [Plastorhodobacter daqingensis]|uniref:histidine kinase n=1 Tax=Plastorhodobacter daqingensis TaxID=1387281 RepID=A0ABW2UHI1_9RHOB